MGLVHEDSTVTAVIVFCIRNPQDGAARALCRPPLPGRVCRAHSLLRLSHFRVCNPRNHNMSSYVSPTLTTEFMANMAIQQTLSSITATASQSPCSMPSRRALEQLERRHGRSTISRRPSRTAPTLRKCAGCGDTGLKSTLSGLKMVICLRCIEC